MQCMKQELENETKDTCMFCKIVNNTIPAHKIYEDEYTIAFLDIMPTHPGHTLVIPKDHFENIYTTPTELYCRIQMTVQKLSLAVRNGVNADGINIISNNEPAAGQVIFHSHVHIIPRHNNDGLTHWPHTTYKTEEEIHVIRKKIIKELAE